MGKLIYTNDAENVKKYTPSFGRKFFPWYRNGGILVILLLLTGATPSTRFTGGRYFDGVDDRITTTWVPSTAVGDNNSFTIECNIWLVSGHNQDNLVIIGNDAGQANKWFGIHKNTGDNWTPSCGNYIGAITLPTIARDKWFHFAFVNSVETGNMLFYFNGALVNTTNRAAPTNNYNTSACPIGNHGAGVGNYPFKGALSELRIWRGARSQTQIQSWMNRRIGAGNIIQNPGKFPNLVLYCPFDETNAGYVEQKIASTGIATNILGTTIVDGASISPLVTP